MAFSLKDDVAYRREVLPLFIARDYAAALPRFEAYVPMALCPKDAATIRARIINCRVNGIGSSLDRHSPDGTRPSDWDRIIGYSLEYLQRLAEAAEMSIEPTKAVFADVLRFVIAYELEPATLIKEIFHHTPSDFCVAFLDALIARFVSETTNYERRGFVEIGKALGYLYLELADAYADKGSVRVAVRNRLAEMVFFQADGREGEAALAAEALLAQSINEDPTNVFARRLQAHIRQRESTILQIKRFQHDTNSRLAGIKPALRKLRSDRALIANCQHELDVIESNLTAIDAINLIVQGIKPIRARVDPTVMCRRVAQQQGLSDRSVTVIGEPAAWKLFDSYLAIALENLIKNSLETYGRRHRAKPAFPVYITIDHTQRSIEVWDQAGGVSSDSRDIFLPYVSEKGIQLSTGLGLAQARKAVELQNGTLTLAERQPEDGAKFVIQFTT